MPLQKSHKNKDTDKKTKQRRKEFETNTVKTFLHTDLKMRMHALNTGCAMYLLRGEKVQSRRKHTGANYS